MLAKPIQRILLPMAFLAISTVLSAQGAWLSAWGGGAAQFYDVGVGSEWVMGIRFGPDLSPKLRVMLGLEYAQTFIEFEDDLRFFPSVKQTISYSGQALNLQLLFAYRSGGSEKQETRMIFGGELSLMEIQDAERRYAGPWPVEKETAAVNENFTAGVARIGLRHARNIGGHLWLFAEPWLGLSLDGERMIASPWPDERYLELPRQSAKLGLIVGLEFGPRSAVLP